MSIGLASLAVSIGLVGYMYYEKYQVGETELVDWKLVRKTKIESH